MKQTLSDGEWRLMKLLWESSPRTIGDMVRSPGSETGRNKNTVFVMPGRLESKGMVAVGADRTGSLKSISAQAA